MNIYETLPLYKKELQELKPHDEIQGAELLELGYYKLYTAGHGYLIVPREDKNIKLAEKICEYGYSGKLAIYLEEDCELNEFLTKIS